MSFSARVVKQAFDGVEHLRRFRALAGPRGERLGDAERLREVLSQPWRRASCTEVEAREEIPRPRRELLVARAGIPTTAGPPGIHRRPQPAPRSGDVERDLCVE